MPGSVLMRLSPQEGFDLAEFCTDSGTTLAAALGSRMVWLTPLEIIWHTTLVMIPTILVIYAISFCSATRVTMLYALMVVRVLASCGMLPALWQLTSPPQDVSKARILWHIAVVCPMKCLISAVEVYMFIQYDVHWKFVNHQVLLFILDLVLQCFFSFALDQYVNPKNFRNDPVTGQPPTCKQVFLREVLQPTFSYCLNNASLAAMLLLASVLRFHLLHEWASNTPVRYLIVGGGFLAHMVLSKVLSKGMIAILQATPEGDEDELPLRLAGMQETFSYYNSFCSLFITKLLVTALQGPVEAWCASIMSAVVEVVDTLYGFWSDTSKVSCLRAELRPAELTDAEASKQEEKREAEIIELRRAVASRAMRYLSVMLLEYVATATAVFAAVIFAGDQLVTGLSNGYWSPLTGLSFLLAQFVPELMSDVLGLAILVKFGVKFRELFDAVNRSGFSLVIKALTGPYALPVVILCALDRKWDKAWANS